MSYDEKPIHIVTPLRHSPALTQLVPGSAGIYLKMENCQIPGSFKVRGFGRYAQKLKKEGHKHLVVPTTGNTGFSVAHAAKLLGVDCTIYIPEFTPQETLKKFQLTGAKVEVTGKDYDQCQRSAQEYAKQPGNVFVNPTDPELWAGHSTLVDELVTQLPEKPSVIAVSVSDGCFMIGILNGLKRAGWEDVPVLAMETIGADCFNLSLKANKLIDTEVTSIAYSLGSRMASPQLWKMKSEFSVLSEAVSDAQAVESCIRFVDDEFTLVEPACGATLAAAYSGVLAKLHAEGRIPHLNTRPAVLVVCGGRVVSLRLLQEWAKEFNLPYPYSAKEK